MALLKKYPAFSRGWIFRQALRDLLIDHAGKRIMLIAHSMGSIVAYDVLRLIGDERPDFTIEHLLTIGSPLGLPYVGRKVIQEHRAARTPSVVRRWSNLADRWDRIATDVVLNGDYGPNTRGVEPADDLVLNLYVGRSGEPNHHKSWGYLRTPELSRLVLELV